MGRTSKPSHLPYAGVSTYTQVVRQSGARTAGVRASKGDLSLLQPGFGKPDYNLRIDPGAFTAAAGGYMKPSRLAEFMDTGKSTRPVKPQERTDPITHFEHEGVEHHGPNFTQNPKRTGYPTVAASQTWTWALDPKVRDCMNLHRDPHPSKQKFAVGANGERIFMPGGVEDLLEAATKEYVKCDRPPPLAHIRDNDTEHMAYCWRDLALEHHDENSKRAHDHWRSSRIWEVMRHGESDRSATGDVRESDGKIDFKSYWKNKLENLKGAADLSEDDDSGARECSARLSDRSNLKHTRKKSSRSLPPEQHFSEFKPNSHGPPSSCCSSRPSTPQARPSRTTGREAKLERSSSARLYRSPVEPSRSSQGSAPRRTSEPASPSVFSSSRSEVSLSMTPLTITRSGVSGHRGSTPRSSRRSSHRNY